MSEARPAVDRARSLFAAGRPRDAERVLLDALDPAHRDVTVLRALGALYLETRRLPECTRVLWRVTELDPTDAETYHTLAAALTQLGRAADLGQVYERMLAHRPEDAVACFNLAWCRRREDRLEEALALHERALALGIDRPQEVWTSIGVIQGELHRSDAARGAFETALSLDPRWIPALYDLALWHEEHGDRAAAITRFEEILAIDPNWHPALFRLVHAQTIPARDDPRIAQLEALLAAGDLPPPGREGAHFALGKALDDCGEWDDAFAQFAAGNASIRARVGAWDRDAAARRVAAARALFVPEWLARRAVLTPAPIVFVCGPYRSGSTLVEQMLGAHPAIAAGGEIGYFRARIVGDPRWPEKLAAMPDEAIDAIGRGYVDRLTQALPADRIVTDKHPENVFLLPLLARWFPGARFVHTDRDARDMGLSIFTQQLDDSLAWATDLDDIAFELRLRRALLADWRSTLGDRLHEVRYERLVDDPAGELARLCLFLGIDVRPDMLHFHETAGRVRTASVWQVRAPLNRDAVGRFRRYERHLSALNPLVAEDP